MKKQTRAEKKKKGGPLGAEAAAQQDPYMVPSLSVWLYYWPALASHSDSMLARFIESGKPENEAESAKME